jgi:hypothetical protein
MGRLFRYETNAADPARWPSARRVKASGAIPIVLGRADQIVISKCSMMRPAEPALDKTVRDCETALNQKQGRKR